MPDSIILLDAREIFVPICIILAMIGASTAERAPMKWRSLGTVSIDGRKVSPT